MLECLLLAHLLAAPAVAVAPPWEARFFSAPGQEIIAAARALPASDEHAAVVLFDERLVTFSNDGRSRARRRLVYEITSPAGLRAWAEIAAGWASWHESRPQLRARVIDASGGEHLLDEKTIEESGTRSSEPTIYSDRHMLRAPLPALEVGAVVEAQIDSDGGPVVAGAGQTGSWEWGKDVPVRKSRLVIEHPAALPLRLVQLPRASVTPVIARADGTVRVVLEAGPLEATPPAEPFQPDDVPPRPLVLYGTAASWADLSRRYGELVERRLAGADMAVLAHEIVGDERDRAAMMRLLLARLHREVRYTGVELGAAAFEPGAPAEVWKRRYGDCKDKATLLVALLRAVGVNAQVALLHAASGLGVRPELPGLESFDHAIVYVPGPKPLWIDPTAAYTPLGELPLVDQGRHALIIAPGTTALALIPRDDVRGSRVVETTTITLGEEGPAHMTNRRELFGAAAREARSFAAETERRELVARLEGRARSIYAIKALSKWKQSDPRDLWSPYWIELEASAPGVARGEADAGWVTVRPGIAFERLPPELHFFPENQAARKERQTDFQLVEPFTYDLRYHVVAPHGFVADPLPPAETAAWGAVSYGARFEPGRDRAVDVTIHLEADRRRLTARAYETMRDGIRKFLAATAPRLRFHSAGSAALAGGNVAEALRLYRGLDREHPEQAVHARQIAYALLEAGLGEAARREARRGVALAPASARASSALGFVLEHDLLGRYQHRGWDPAGAEAAYRTTLALDPEDDDARLRLATLLSRGPQARFNPSAAHVAAAEPLWRALSAAGKPEARVDWLLALARLGRFAEVIEHGRGVELSNVGHACVLWATAMGGEGAAGAIALANARIPVLANRREALWMAAAELKSGRHYPEARALGAELARLENDSPRARELVAALASLRRSSEQPREPTVPVTVARHFVAALAALDDRERDVLGADPAPAAKPPARPQAGRPPPSPLAPFAAPELVAALAAAETRGPIIQALREVTAMPAPASAALAADRLWTIPLELYGDAKTGFLVTFVGPRQMSLLVAPRPEGLRVLAAGASVAAALEAGRLARAGDLAAGVRWLGWIGVARERLKPMVPDKAAEERAAAKAGLSGMPIPATPFGVGYFYSPEPESLPELEHEVALQIAAATRMDAALPGDANATLLACAANEPRPERRRRCARVVVERVRAQGKPAEALALADRLDVPGLESLRQTLMLEAGRFAEIHDAVVAASGVGAPALQRAAADLLMAGGDLAAAEATYRRLVSKAPTALDLNQLAWLRVVAGDAGEATLDAAKRSVELTKRKGAASLHTLATVLAERGDAAGARDTLREALDARAAEAPASYDHFVLGRIAEIDGLTDVALEEYRQVEPAQRPNAVATWILAERRRKALALAPAR